MPSFTRIQYEKIKDALAIAEMRHYTFKETVDYISTEVGIPMKYDTVAHMKPRLKQKMGERFSLLLKDRNEYQYELTKTLEQKENLINSTWDLFTRADTQYIQLHCIKTINEIQNDKWKILHDLTDIVKKTNYKEQEGDYIDLSQVQKEFNEHPSSDTSTAIF